MQTLTVDLGQNSYPIYVGEGLLKQKALIKKHIAARQVMLVTNQKLAEIYLTDAKQLFTDFDLHTVILPDGEAYKTLKTLNLVYSELLQKRFDRSCTIVALGGGVVGDIAGFAAASYQRGVAFIQIPTTLLAQVDSSVGGKTGVNHALGKNMIGAFHQPNCVLIDVNTLDTLPKRELSAGLAEVIKYALLMDIDFLRELEKHIDAISQCNKQQLQQIIIRSCRYKAQIVAADEREAGRRALLNLGHTFGHAIEKVLGYGEYLHGEAVAVGMLMAASLSNKLGYLSAKDVTRIKQLLKQAHLPIRIHATVGKSDFLAAMAVDKKARDGVIHLILLKKLGTAFLCKDYDLSAFHETLDEFITSEH